MRTYDDTMEGWLVFAIALVRGCNSYETAYKLYETGRRPKHKWTAEQDRVIIEGRKNGLTFYQIADALDKEYRATHKRWRWLRDNNKLY